MKLEENKTNLWNKINGGEYIDIPECDLDKGFNLDEKKVFNDSNDIYGMIILIGVIGFLIMIGKLIIQFDEIRSEPVIYLVWATICIFLIFIGDNYANRKKTPILTLTKKDLKYGNEIIEWTNIKNMYVKRQNDGDTNHYDLIVEYNRDFKETFSLDDMEEDYKTIMEEISKYYWTGIRNNNAI